MREVQARGRGRSPNHVHAVLGQAHLDEVEDPRLVIDHEHGWLGRAGGARVGGDIGCVTPPFHATASGERKAGRFRGAPLGRISQHRLSGGGRRWEVP